MFLLPRVAEIKDLVVYRILDEVIAPVEERFKTIGELRFIEQLNSKIFYTVGKKFQIDDFSTLSDSVEEEDFPRFHKKENSGC